MITYKLQQVEHDFGELKTTPFRIELTMQTTIHKSRPDPIAANRPRKLREDPNSYGPKLLETHKATGSTTKPNTTK